MLPGKLVLPLTVSVLLGLVPTALAARWQFHYVPADASPYTALKPAGVGYAGEGMSWTGAAREPCRAQSRPNFVAPFCHPWTGQTVWVPLALPEGTPRVEHVGARVVYNYGSYTVSVQFLPDGSVEVAYDSGFLRR
jgi:hypothetical protein